MAKRADRIDAVFMAIMPREAPPLIPLAPSAEAGVADRRTARIDDTTMTILRQMEGLAKEVREVSSRLEYVGASVEKLDGRMTALRELVHGVKEDMARSSSTW